MKTVTQLAPGLIFGGAILIGLLIMPDHTNQPTAPTTVTTQQ